MVSEDNRSGAIDDLEISVQQSSTGMNGRLSILQADKPIIKQMPI